VYLEETVPGPGKPIPYNDNAVEWMEQTASGHLYDQATMRLTLRAPSLIPIYTTPVTVNSSNNVLILQGTNMYKHHGSGSYQLLLKRMEEDLSTAFI
jgi:hypothetical protein